jgi:hypothetical protein
MAEHGSGKGRLVSLAADSSVYTVAFVLDVDTEVIGRSEIAPAKLVRRYRLQVEEQAIPEGDYTLRTPNEIFAVRKTGQKWQVINFGVD